MKSVTGEIKSTTPVTLSRAAGILSDFVARDTGASQAVTAYLRRATSAFDELVQFHNSLPRRYEKHKSDITTAAAAGPTTSLAAVDEDPRRVQQSNHTALSELNRPNHSNDSKKKSKSKSVVVKEEQRKGEGNGEVGEESISKKKKKKEKSGHGSECEVKSEGVNVKAVEEGNGKKKKKHKSIAQENGEVDGYKENGQVSSGGMRIKEEEEKSEGLKLNAKEENRKKRKSGEAEEQSEERPRKKRK
ncbi:hypothetical protein LINGRAHAP2_LOCUS26925 [Linum grandiflorum]